ncbi:MAG: NADH-quinone oxidoreductase subunit NuoB [Alphaproteobacteria bacterium]|nr:NADH-quinone oxidoreductase subunit NuoB [Alphaproteobacteria bacterium]
MLKLLAKALLKGPVTEPAPEQAEIQELADKIDASAKVKLGRSLVIREIDAGSCNACELEIHALGNPLYDIERFGIRFAASPRHADVLLVTGPVARNMAEALKRTYDATPGPKWVVAMGDCAIDGGCFKGGYACLDGVDKVVPVDVRIPGCPPSPTDLLKNLLALLETVR